MGQRGTRQGRMGKHTTGHSPGSGLRPENFLRSAAGLHVPEGFSPELMRDTDAEQTCPQENLQDFCLHEDRGSRFSVWKCLSSTPGLARGPELTLAGRLSHFCQPHMDFPQIDGLCPSTEVMSSCWSRWTRNQGRDARLHCLTVHVCL